MGVCVTKQDRESADQQAGLLLSDPSITTTRERNNLQEDNTALAISSASDSPNLLKLDARKVIQRLVKLRGNN